MSLRAGHRYTLLTEIPEESRPDGPPIPVQDLPTGQGQRHNARLSNDGTRWCLSCLFTLDRSGQAVLCPTCKLERDRILKANRRRARPSTVAVPRSAIERLDEATREVDRIIGVIMAARNARTRLNGEVFLDLTAASKEVAALIQAEFRSLLQADERPRRL